CIGQIWPGSNPGQQTSSSSAMGTARQQNASGAATTPATWHASQTQTTHEMRRRTKGMIDKVSLTCRWPV
ncbi:MAG TPA: hypothetical protein VNG89_03910, partial [Vicinamibacterales bacterium]|nr:hypothetical protein [Vicinamibacterales bacterium]